MQYEEIYYNFPAMQYHQSYSAVYHKTATAVTLKHFHSSHLIFHPGMLSSRGDLIPCIMFVVCTYFIFHFTLFIILYPFATSIPSFLFPPLVLPVIAFPFPFFRVVAFPELFLPAPPLSPLFLPPF